MAIRALGGPSIATHFGRLDAQANGEGAHGMAGRLPNGDEEQPENYQVIHWFGIRQTLKLMRKVVLFWPKGGELVC